MSEAARRAWSAFDAHPLLWITWVVSVAILAPGILTLWLVAYGYMRPLPELQAVARVYLSIIGLVGTLTSSAYIWRW